jgi:hypothetical protein
MMRNKSLAMMLGGLLVAPGIASAEFEIPEVDVDRGSVEAEYRGASHWGLPAPSDDGDIDALRQSHELEIQYGLTDWWALRITPNAEQPEGTSLDLATVGIETQFVLRRRDGGALGLAFMLGYGPFTELVDVDAPDEFELGPVIELAGKRWLATFNPRLAWELGQFAEHDSAGFEYAAQLRYQVARRWAVAVLGFGEIENLADAGGVEEQVHLFGSGFYLFSRNGAGSGIEAGRWANAAGQDEELRWSLGAGLLFGLTEASDDTTLRVTFAVER